MEKLKETVLKYKNIITALLTIFVAVGLNLKFIQEGNYFKLDSSTYSVLYLIFIGIIVYIINLSLKIKDKRLWTCSTVFGIIFGICLIIGDICNVYKDTLLPSSKKFILYIIMKIITYAIIFTPCIVNIISMLPKLNQKWKIENKEYKFFTANKKSFVVIGLIFFIIEIPIFLHAYPGSFFWDATNGLEQVLGAIPYKDHQPIIYTVFIGALWNFGKAVFNDGSIGFAVYSIIQMLVTSFGLSYLLYYMAKKRIPTKFRAICFTIFLLNPLIHFYSVRIEKSIFFAILLILANIQIIEMLTNTKEYMKNKIHYITFPLEILLLSLLRNNGIYISLAIFIIILIIKKEYWKNILILFLVPIIIFYTIKGPLWKALNIIPMGSEEALSIPMQQFARLIKYEKDNLTTEEYNEIHKYLDMTDEEIIEDYKPTISDDIKENMNAESFKNDKLGLIKLYFELALKFPGQTISSILVNSYGYYSPNNNMLYGCHNYNEESAVVVDAFNYGTDVYKSTAKEENDKLENKKLLNSKLLEWISTHFELRDIPIINLISTSVGMYFWIFLIGIAYLIYSKKYKFLIAYLPIFLLWATTVIGSLVELRYLYTLMLFIIPLSGMALNFENKNGGKNER